ncbi:MAG: trypsin-like serine protease [Paracoccaceae bacterium]|nr:trypsin-like serine protease [Paracoccaceae bacterium]
MRKIFLLILAAWFVATGAHARDSKPAISLVSADNARAWEAVGKVELVGTGFCTGALIRPDLVLTAAHCMFDKRTGRRVPTRDIEFLAGWRKGRAAAVRSARRVIIHEGYQYNSPRKLERVSTDIALIELDRPIRNSRIMPFGWARRPRIGQRVEVVSYSRNHPEVPALQDSCKVLGRDPGVLVLSCQVTFGASGSPIFVVENGVPRIASIISAKAEWKNRAVSLGTSLGRPLETLIRVLDNSDGVFTRIQPVSLRNTRKTGAKFLKP